MTCTLLTRECPDGVFSASLYGTTGPLAVCLHGFPDLPASFDPLVPALVAAGFRVLVPVMRGYEPTSVHSSGHYHALYLGDDVIAWLDHLGESRASLIGHDWGAVAGWAAIARAPQRFACFVALSIPHTGAFLKALPFNPRQWRNSWYMSYFQLPRLPERALADVSGSLVRRLWSDWSPGWEPPGAHLSAVIERLSQPDIGPAVLGYYRCLFRPWEAPNRKLLSMMGLSPRVPVLALAGQRDGCVRPAFFSACMQGLGSPGIVDHALLPDVGHFLHLENPEVVLRHMIPFLARWNA